MQMNQIFTPNIGDLSEAPRASFYRFLLNGISEEFQSFRNPFLSKIRLPKRRRISCLIYLYPSEVKLKGPVSDISTCLVQDLTYATQLYIKGEYSYLTDQKNQFISKEKYKELKLINSPKLKTIQTVQVFQDIFFGEIPLMTEEGTFIITGCERIVISQIIRSPGIYFRKEFSTSKRKLNYTATVISNKGLWTKFVLDEYQPKIDRKSKSLENEYSFELPFSPKTAKSFQKFQQPRDRIYMRFDEFKLKKRSSKKKEEESILELNRLHVFELLLFFGMNFQEITDSVKHPFRFNSSTFIKMGKQGGTYERNLLLKKMFLNQRSGCFSIGEIGRYKINKKLGLNLPKDITYLTAHDFLGIIDGLIDLKYYDRPSDDIDHIKNKQIRSVGELLQNQIKIGLYRLEKNIKENAPIRSSQKLNFEFEIDSDPDDWIVDPRPLTGAVKEFFKTSQLSQYMDQTNPLAELTHKRKISVFGPNGLKRDHISTVIRDIHPSQYGRFCPIETSEGQNAGLIMSTALYGRISSFGWIETPYFFMKDRKVFSEKRPIFLNPEQESEMQVAVGDSYLTKGKEISTPYVSVKENYIFSVKKTEEVNFITTSPLQIVSLATALIPFLEHDDANRALMGANMQRQAVPLLYPQKPIVGTGFESIALLDSGMVIKSYCEGLVSFSSSEGIIISDSVNQKLTFHLRKYFRSNQETAFNQRPIVWPGEVVFSGQILADGPSSLDGELALGRNLTIAYMPFEGYNYEDAIVISERLVLEDCLTSIHIEEHETRLTYGLVESEKITNELPHLTKYITRNLNFDGIIKIGAYVREHDILVGKLTLCEEDDSPEARLIRALYGKENPNYRDSSLKTPHGTEGRVIDVRKISTTIVNQEEPSLCTSCLIIRVYIAQIRKIQVGDKLAGRHGNKGIVSKILSRQDMPYLPNGMPIDIIFNPLGVPSRMNVGQIFECLLGFAGEKLEKRFKISPFDEIYGKEASRVLVNQKLKEAAIQSNCNWIFHPLFPGKILLRDGRTGEFFDNPITVGKSYILKLIHLVEDKIHARATGPYSMITEQPLAGKSQKGGQRFGEMEVWAIEAYGCANTLQELLTIKSDDIDGRNDMYEAILVRQNVQKPTPSIPESFTALIRELNSLGLDFSIRKFQNQFDETSNIKTIEKDLFQDLEDRLKLRALLSRKKAEQFAKLNNEIEKSSLNEGKSPIGENISSTDSISTPKKKKGKISKEKKIRILEKYENK